MATKRIKCRYCNKPITFKAMNDNLAVIEYDADEDEEYIERITISHLDCWESKDNKFIYTDDA